MFFKLPYNNSLHAIKETQKHYYYAEIHGQNNLLFRQYNSYAHINANTDYYSRFGYMVLAYFGITEWIK